MASTRPLPNLVDKAAFRVFLHHEVAKAIRLRYCVSLVCLTPDAPERSAVVWRFTYWAMRRVRAIDVGMHVEAGGVAVLLVDADAASLPAIVGRMTMPLPDALPRGTAPAARLAVSGGGSCYPRTSSNAGELWAQAMELMARARKDGGNRLYLPDLASGHPKNAPLPRSVP